MGTGSGNIAGFRFRVSTSLLGRRRVRLVSSVEPKLVRLRVNIRSAGRIAVGRVREAVGLRELGRIIELVRDNGGVRRRLSLVTKLPCRSCSDFKHSFSRVCRLGPGRLRLKFLGILGNSCVFRRTTRCNVICRSGPPCRIVSAG